MVDGFHEATRLGGIRLQGCRASNDGLGRRRAALRRSIRGPSHHRLAQVFSRGNRPHSSESLAALPGKVFCPVSQRHEIGRANPPARTGQQPEHRIRPFGISKYLEDGEQFNNFRGAEKSTQTNNLNRNPPVCQLPADRLKLSPAAAQHGNGGSKRPPQRVLLERP